MNKLKNIKPLTEGKMKSGVKEQKGTSKPIAPPPSPGSTSKNVTSIETFLNTELVNYASYDNIRKIASIMDGLKNSGRKVIATALDSNIKDNLKVLQFSNRAAEQQEYLHGSLDGVVVTLAKEYAGTNNLALLQGKGNFGTRFTNEASAPRYIYARKKDYLDDLFIKDDTKVLIEQFFEGSKIEPKFYTPTLPLLLINGSQGISSGFAQNILPRNANEMKEYLLKILDGVKPRKFPMPSFNGFEGTVIHGDNPNQFIIQGKVKKLSANRVLIEEIPVQYDLKGYIAVLDKLEDDKLIQGYKDLSNDSFKFEVQIPSKVLGSMTDAELLEFLKLRRTVSENYTSMTHENKIKEYTNPEDILNDYIEVKLVYTEKRKQHLLNELASKIELLNSRYIFIEAVVDNKLIISKRKKAVIIKDIDKLGILKETEGDTRYDYLLRMPVSSMTEEELKRLKGLVKDAETEIKELKKLSAKDLWLKDIHKLKI